jgi:hypothetical protein
MEEPTKKDMVFKSQKVQKIWGSALKYLPELLEELAGDRDDVESQVVT